MTVAALPPAVISSHPSDDERDGRVAVPFSRASLQLGVGRLGPLE